MSLLGSDAEVRKRLTRARCSSPSLSPARRSIAAIERLGQMPLPPYIAGKRPADARDAHDYQTLFAPQRRRGRGADREPAFHAGAR